MVDGAGYEEQRHLHNLEAYAVIGTQGIVGEAKALEGAEELADLNKMVAVIIRCRSRRPATPDVGP